MSRDASYSFRLDFEAMTTANRQRVMKLRSESPHLDNETLIQIVESDNSMDSDILAELDG